MSFLCIVGRSLTTTLSAQRSDTAVPHAQLLDSHRRFTSLHTSKGQELSFNSTLGGLFIELISSGHIIQHR
ncbi:hypothetical protein KOW79_016413 [Hemibagrus wyckioides]|uniref:Uncharacterized protein n=1 Tax=Hemibagrus wyckioides TaxID=337641 RepID=A0A9D3NEB0_9TELE|nr:hypothetical protein KOW79_016413 [Hemibagrus wyckioides]